MATAPFRMHIFVCENHRPPSDPRGCCADKGSEALRQLFKDEVKKRGLAGPGKVRVNSAGCLDQCELGISCVVYPEGVWYTLRDANDVREIVEEHVVNGRPVERLRMKVRGK